MNTNGKRTREPDFSLQRNETDHKTNMKKIKLLSSNNVDSVDLYEENTSNSNLDLEPEQCDETCDSKSQVNTNPGNAVTKDWGLENFINEKDKIIQEAMKEKERIIQEAKEEAEKIIQEATKEKDKILKEANELKEKTIQDTTQQKDKLMKDTTKEIDDLKKEIKDIEDYKKFLIKKEVNNTFVQIIKENDLKKIKDYVESNKCTLSIALNNYSFVKHMFHQHNSYEVVEFVLKLMESTINSFVENIFIEACGYGNLNIVDYIIIKFGEANVRPHCGSALSLALLNEREEVIRWLITKFYLPRYNKQNTTNTPPINSVPRPYPPVRRVRS